MLLASDLLPALISSHFTATRLGFWEVEILPWVGVGVCALKFITSAPYLSWESRHQECVVHFLMYTRTHMHSHHTHVQSRAHTHSHTPVDTQTHMHTLRHMGAHIHTNTLTQKTYVCAHPLQANVRKKWPEGRVGLRGGGCA